MHHISRRREMRAGFGWGNLKKSPGRTRHRWEDSILKWILNV
jgi:hypothetical protein